MRWIQTFALGGTLLLGACAAPGGYSPLPAGERLTVGTELQVVVPFNYPAGRDTLWFQRGEITTPLAIDVWDWHCSLDLHPGGPARRVLHLGGGRFVISGIREDRLIVQSGPVPLGAGPFSSDAHYLFTVEFGLASPDYPEVRALRCERRFQLRSGERALSLGELRAQLGRYLAVRPPSR